MAYASRAKADAVLSLFDSLKTTKLLYSISNEHFYVLINVDCKYIEYYIYADSSNIIKEKRFIEHPKQNIALLSKAVDVNKYHQVFITKVNDVIVTQGNPSYFVVKDKDGKRYGEYWLPVITSPIPIDQEVYNYLFSELLKQSSKNEK